MTDFQIANVNDEFSAAAEITIRIVCNKTGAVAKRFTMPENKLANTYSYYFRKLVIEQLDCFPEEWCVNGHQFYNFDDSPLLEPSMYYSKTFEKSIWVVSAFLHTGENTPALVNVAYLKNDVVHKVEVLWSRLETTKTFFERLKQEIGFPWSYQVKGDLKYKGKALRLDAVKAYFGIDQETNPRVFLTYRGGFTAKMTDKDYKTVCVKTLTGKSLTVPWFKHEDVEILKWRIYEMEGIPFDQQRMIYKQTQLKDEYTKSQYRIPEEDAILHLVLRLRGGGVAPVSFADVSNGPASLVCFDDWAPDWRLVGSGLNIEGVCTNEYCEAFNDEIISPMGLRVFDLTSKTTASCPICQYAVKPVQCGFYQCKYRFWGAKIENADNGQGKKLKPFRSDWINAPSDKYALFSENTHGIVSWERLVIETECWEWSRRCLLCFKSGSDNEMRTVECCKLCIHKRCLEKCAENNDGDITELFRSLDISEHSNSHILQ
ncbi:hypothetical protein HK098_002823 [Nowakowskiella sp. JEL0407]|nr:hypothetical protein HK098_002823 [Nowakowskiella sp. JEL0407]